MRGYLKKKYKGKILLLIIIGIIAISIFSVKARQSSINTLLGQIERSYIEQAEVDEQLFNEVIAQIETKLQRNEKLNAKEYFILGYKYYAEGEYKIAIEDFNLSNQKAKVRKEDFVRICNGIYLSQIYSKTGQDAQALKVIQEALVGINTKEFDRRYNSIIKLLNSIIHTPNGRGAGIEILEGALQDANKLDKEHLGDIKNKLSVLYLSNGNYAKGLEQCLEVVAMRNSIKNKYYVVKAYVDMGVLYGSLGDFQNSREWIEKSLEIDVADEKQNALVKSYALVNLYASILSEGDYEELIHVSHRTKEYIDLLPEEEAQAIELISNSILSSYYLKAGDIVVAKKAFEVASALYEMESPYIQNETEIFYNIALSDLLRVEGDLEEAEAGYKNVLQMSYEKGNPSMAREALDSLIEMLNKEGKYEKANIYEAQRLQLLEKEAVLVNRDYAEYALYKYEFETNQMEITLEKMRRYVSTSVVVLMIIASMLVVYIKYTTLNKMYKLDGLTKAYNRRYFEDCYKTIMERQEPFILIMMDIDNFKSINDTWGHIFGDYVIKAVASTAEQVIEGQGKLFRYGGEEFVVLLEDKPREEILEIAEAIRTSVANYKWKNDLTITISIGISRTTKATRDILERADQNLYVSKTTGKNKVTYSVES